jgi:dienelactone hydrolase
MDDSTPAAEKAFWAGDEMDRLTQQVRQLGNVVGLVGFSMGAKMAMEVARRLENADAGGGKERTAAGVKIVVCVCGTAPFHGGLSGDIGKGEKDSEREALYREALAKGVVKAASVHWIAARDPWRAESERLVEFFDEGTRKVICARGAHHMPLDDTANGQLAKMVLEAVGR